MYSDDNDYHSESEFYYPGELEKENDKRNAGLAQNSDNLDEFQKFIEGQRSENTTKKTTYDLNVWNWYCASVKEARKLDEIPATELNVHLCKFFMNVMKKDGSVYEPTSPMIPEQLKLQHKHCQRPRIFQVPSSN